MQQNAIDLDYYRRICDAFRVTGSLESKEGRKGFRSKVLVDFLTCENGFSASIGQKYADSRADATTHIGKNLVKYDFIHHYRDALEFGDDEGFFRFLEDEPAQYFQERQTVLSLVSPIREVRPGKVLWTCEDILLGSDLEVWNCAIVVLHKVNDVASLYAYRDYYDKYPKFSVIVRDSVRLYRLNDTSSQQIAVAIKSKLQDGASFTYSLLFHHHWYALSFASIMIDCGATYSNLAEEASAEAACAAIAAHLSFNDFSDTLDSALQLIEETERPFDVESQLIVSSPEIEFLRKILIPENVRRMKYFTSIKFCMKLCSDFSEAEMDPKQKNYWKSAAALFTRIVNIESTLAPFSEPFAGYDVAIQTTENVRATLPPALTSVLKSLELSEEIMDSELVSLPPKSESEAFQLISRSDCIENYWQSLAIMCEAPGWPPHRDFVRFDIILHRKTSHFIFSKRWLRHFYACRGCKLYYQRGSADTKEGLESFIASNPADDYKYCVPLTGCMVEPLEIRDSYFPFVITLFRLKDQEPVTIELAADDEYTRKQCIAVIKVASTLSRSEVDSRQKESIIADIALQPHLLTMRNQAALDGVLKALQKPSVDIDDFVQLKNAGFSMETLRSAGVDAGILRVAGWSVRDLRLGGVSFKELYQSGCTARSLFAAGFTAKELRDAGLSAQEMKSAGVDLMTFKTMGFELVPLQNAGFDSAMLTVSFFDGRFDPLALKQANFSAQTLKSAGFSAQVLKEIGFDLKSLLPPVFDVFTLVASKILPEEIASVKPTFVITEVAQKIRASLSRNELPSFVLRELFGENKQSYLLYDSFTDGDTPRCFHRFCDLKGPNLTLVSSREGFVLGAYTTASWDSGGGSFPSPGAFLVPLINLASIPWSTKFCLKDQNDSNVIICDNCSGPRFYGTLEIRGGYHKDKKEGNRTSDSQFDQSSKILVGFSDTDICPFEGDPNVTCKSFLEPLPGHGTKKQDYGGNILNFIPHRVQVFSITNLGDSLNKIAAEAVVSRGRERAFFQQQAVSSLSELDESLLNSSAVDSACLQLRHVSSGFYVQPRQVPVVNVGEGCNQLILGPEHATAKFMLLPDGSLKHIESGLFIHSQSFEGGADAEKLLVLDADGLGHCRVLAFDLTDAGCLVERGSGFFVHPRGGKGLEGVELVLLAKGLTTGVAEEITFELENVGTFEGDPPVGGSSDIASFLNIGRDINTNAAYEARPSDSSPALMHAFDASLEGAASAGGSSDPASATNVHEKNDNTADEARPPAN